MLQMILYFSHQGSVLQMMKGAGEEVENEAQFTGVMQAFGQSFLQPDISIFKQNLETLESLNSKWKLYHKVPDISLSLSLSLFVRVSTPSQLPSANNLCHKEAAPASASLCLGSLPVRVLFPVSLSHSLPFTLGLSLSL